MTDSRSSHPTDNDSPRHATLQPLLAVRTWLAAAAPLVAAGAIGSALTLGLISGQSASETVHAAGETESTADAFPPRLGMPATDDRATPLQLAQAPRLPQPSIPPTPIGPVPELPSEDSLPPAPNTGGERVVPRKIPATPRVQQGDALGSSVEITPAPLTEAERTAAAVYEACNRSVVNIAITSIRPVGPFRQPRAEQSDSGSGIVLDRQGHILTNNHVIESARQVQVTLHDGRSYRGRLIGTDPLNDIAVLKIEAPAETLEPVKLADSDSIVVGQRVFAIGNPFGLSRTLSTGIVASVGRTLEVQEDWVIKEVIQIDASINPGNSGGPLLDAAGRLIGMNTAIAAETRQSAGIGFAIPTRLILRTVPELLEHGRIVRGVIGIDQMAETAQGLRIHRLVPGGAAERAGLRGPLVRVREEGPYIIREIDPSQADVIVSLDGQAIDSTAEFNVFLDGKKPGEVVEVTVLREKELQKVRVVLGGEQPRSPSRRL